MRHALLITVLGLALATPASAGDTINEADTRASEAVRRVKEAMANLKAAGDKAPPEMYAAIADELRAAQAELKHVQDLVNLKTGRPIYRIEITGKSWKPKHKWVRKRVRGHMGQAGTKPFRVSDGGWLTLRAKITAERLPRKVTAAKLLVTCKELEGFQTEYHWKPSKKLVKQGDTITAKLQVYVAQEQMEGFWMKEADVSHIQKQMLIDPQWVIYESGDKWGR